jgi:hypothetical protein
MPGLSFAPSSISPLERWKGSLPASRIVTLTGPNGLVPVSSICTISVGICSRPLPSVSRSSPSFTWTVVGPLSSTMFGTAEPAGTRMSASALDLGKKSTSTGCR